MLTYLVFLTFIFVKISDTNADLDESVGAALNDHEQHFTLPKKQKLSSRDVAAAPQTPQLGGAQANFGGPS